MQLALGGKGSNITQIENLYINAHVDLEEIKPLIRSVLDELEHDQPEKGLSNLSVACLRLAEKVKGEYVRPALLIAAQNANLIPESALMAMTIHEIFCEMSFDANALTLEAYVSCFANKIEKLLSFTDLPSGLDWMDNLFMTRMLYFYDKKWNQNMRMDNMLQNIILKKYYNGTNGAFLHQVWYTHADLRRTSSWHDQIPMPFGLTLAGIALSRVYLEYRGVNPSYVENF